MLEGDCRWPEIVAGWRSNSKFEQEKVRREEENNSYRKQVGFSFPLSPLYILAGRVGSTDHIRILGLVDYPTGDPHTCQLTNQSRFGHLINRFDLNID